MYSAVFVYLVVPAPVQAHHYRLAAAAFLKVLSLSVFIVNTCCPSFLSSPAADEGGKSLQ